MGIYNTEDILAYHLCNGNESELVCAEHITDEDNITEDSIMTEEDFDEAKSYFCDRCGERFR